MKRILVVTGSARPHSINQIVVKMVVDDLTARDVEVTIADLAAMELPYMSGALAPSNPNYTVEDPKAQAWQQQVADAEGVVFVAPEYNHSMSAIQKNAIDWLYKEWNDKPAAFIGYGAYAAKHSYAQFLEVNSVVKMDVGETMTGINLPNDIDWDGTVKNEAAIKQMIAATLDELVARV